MLALKKSENGGQHAGRVGSSMAFFAALLLALLIASPAAQADSVADFYRGKTVNMLIGVYREYDLKCRLVARFSSSSG